jgi:hypothetical protein
MLSGKEQVMRVLELDASGWKTTSDYYDAILAAVGAPAWHGRVPIALVDTMFHYDVNKVVPPYRVEVRNSADLPFEVKDEVVGTAELFEEVRARRRARDEFVDVSIVLV